MTVAMAFDDDRDDQPKGSSVVETDALLASETALAHILRRPTMGAFVGESGTGKTFAMRELIGELSDVDVIWLEFESRPTMLHIARRIYESLFDEPPTGNRNEITSEIVDGLRGGQEQKLLLVVDEAQRLNTECIEYLRFLHDHIRTRFSMAILGGNGAWTVISNEPMLLSRIHRRVTFSPITDEVLVETIRNYHSMYEEVPEDLIKDIDEYCKGVFRLWATVTSTLIDLLEERKKRKLDDKTVGVALRLIFEG